LLSLCARCSASRMHWEAGARSVDVGKMVCASVRTHDGPHHSNRVAIRAPSDWYRMSPPTTWWLSSRAFAGASRPVNVPRTRSGERRPDSTLTLSYCPNVAESGRRSGFGARLCVARRREAALKNLERRQSQVSDNRADLSARFLREQLSPTNFGSTTIRNLSQRFAQQHRSP
jgi:hypothetical protein